METHRGSLFKSVQASLIWRKHKPLSAVKCDQNLTTNAHSSFETFHFLPELRARHAFGMKEQIDRALIVRYKTPKNNKDYPVPITTADVRDTRS